MATVKDVAKLAGVSIGSVSHVLGKSTKVSERLRQKVMSAVKELNYHPNLVARSLKTKETRVLAILVPDLTIPFYPQLIRGAEKAAAEHNYSLIAISTEESGSRQQKILSSLRAQRVDGILIVAVANRGPALRVGQILDGVIPVVFVDRIPANLQSDFVSIDNMAAAQMCVNHLVEVGHRRIAICTGKLSLDNERERLLGYQNALQKAGIKMDEDLVWESGFRPEEAGALFAQRLSASAGRPTAIFSTNGTTALGVIRALRTCELACPDHISFATFDQITIDDFFRPRITTVIQPAHEMGHLACEVLIRRINGLINGTTVTRIRMPAELLIRESSAFPGKPKLGIVDKKKK